MKRILICMMVAVLLMFGCGCVKTDDPITETTAVTSASIAETEPPVIVANITMSQLADYTVIRPDEASEDIVQAGVKLRQSLIENLNVSLNLKSDLHSETVPGLRIGEFEILIGNCDRDESREFLADMKVNDYGYAMVGKKLVIAGGSDEATLKALNQFIVDVIRNRKAENELFFDGTVSLLNRGEYEIDTFSLQEIDISEYTVIYPNRNETCEGLANELVNRIAQKSGFALAVKSDKGKASGKEILIGTTNRTECAYTSKTLESGSYLLGADNNYICARGADGLGDYYAVYALIGALLDQYSATHSVRLDAEKIAQIPVNQSLKAMSFNVWVSSPTEQRKESVKQTILKYLPDTIGVQEASPTWMSYLTGGLKDIYAYVGLGREGGTKGEHSAIFYRKDRFDLVETGTKWMSDTPDVVSKYSVSSLPRIFTYAILLDKNTNQNIMVVNTHLEHTSAEARNLQVKVLMDFLKDYTEYPIILTGDFNADPSSKVYELVTDQLADSSRIAQKSEQHYTFHNYGSASSYIDYAFVSAKNIAVSHYRVITEEVNGMLPSDHYALVIEYSVLN